MKMIDVLHMPRSIWLGRKTEQNFRPIAFDVYKWLSDYPEATVSIVYTRPDGQVFPVASSDRSPIIWIPQQDVTTVSGEGEIELHLVGGGAVGISASTKTLIDDSAASAQPTAPSWVDQVVQDVTEQADRAEEAAYSIEGSITEKVNEVVPDAVADYMEDHPVTVEETDPTVPTWAKQPTKPTYTAQEVGALPADTPIPPAVTEQTVSEWGFTKNTGTYSKPSGGIPKSDLASDVQASLGKADTALQQHQSLAGYATETYVQQQIAAIPDELPAVTASDNGKSLVVENGVWGKGYQAARTPRVAMTAQDTAPTLEPNRLYVWGETASLTITLAAPADNSIVNEYHFIFASGATPTTLTIPAAVKTPDGFTVDANMVYEVSILEGNMTAMSWEVTA